MKAFVASAAVAAVVFAPRAASAFCGFYVSGADGKLFNDATQVVLMREGTRTVLSMQNDYKGPVSDFAMVVPVPVVLQKENVKTLSRELFDKVDKLSAPRLVEYWEQDPCPKVPAAEGLAGVAQFGKGLGLSGIGSGGGGAGPAVKIEAQFEVGEYEIVILSAQDSGSLDTWLRTNEYKIPENAEPALRPYVTSGSKFFVAKVNAAKVKFEDGRASLSPLRFHYDSETFQLPVKLGMLNSSGTQDLIVNVIAPNEQRYAVANYPEAVIPTNLDVAERARASFASFYAALFDKTLEANPKAVVTEYAWGAQGCDPCPGSVQGLTMAELASLGADVLPSARMGQPSRGLAELPETDVQLTLEMGASKIADAERVVTGMRPRFRSCYLQGLGSDPSQSGSMVIEVTVAENGSVSRANVLTNNGLSPAVATCASSALRRAQLASGGTFKVKVRMTSQKPKTAPASSASAPKEVLVSIGSRFVLTRLHTRYTNGALADDLVFKAAPPLRGGREYRRKDGELERGATLGDKGSSNAFQARYAIRHPWTGSIACDKPIREQWGGPWPDAGVDRGPAAATKLAYAPRDKGLGTFLTKGMPEFRAEIRPASVEPQETPTVSPSASSVSSALTVADAASTDGGTEPPAKGRCGCELPGAPAGGVPRALVAFGALLAWLRARARRGAL